MDSKDLRGLMEAYSEVYAPQEELDEMDVKLKTPEERAKYIEDAKKREERKQQPSIFDYARKRKEEGRPLKINLSRAVAAQNKKEAEKRAALKKEELENVDEATAMAKRGYDEAPIRQKIAKSTGGGKAADRATALSSRPSFGNDRAAQQRERLARTQRGDFRNTTSSSPGLRVGQFKSNDPKVQAKQAARGAQRGALTPAEKQQLNREEFDIFDIVLEFLQAEGYAETLEEAEWMMANVIDEEAIAIVIGEGNPIGRFLSNRKHKLRDTEKGHEDIMRRNREYQTKGKGPGGYRNKGAGRVEKVREEYVDEAQHARENPEKYEREQAKKSAPVRGERTPMPPRGDKRREEFEKWYAANVR